jgi:hypothetical protein
MSLAFLLSAGPTAWKFLSRSSAYSSSDELRITFLGSDGMSATDDDVDDGLPAVPDDEAANFSGGNFTVAANGSTMLYSIIKYLTR